MTQQQSNNNTDAANTLTTASYNTSTVITLINFYDQRVFTPRNNKRRIIRVDGSSICLNQQSVHFRNMSRNSRILSLKFNQAQINIKGK